MTVDELKRRIDETNPEERLALAAYFRHITRKDDPAYRAELFQLNQEIDDGRRLSLENASLARSPERCRPVNGGWQFVLNETSVHFRLRLRSARRQRVLDFLRQMTL